jgi:hypothetical protein
MNKASASSTAADFLSMSTTWTQSVLSQSRKIAVDVKGEILELKNTRNTMVDQLNAFAGEVSRVAREVGTEGKLGGQAAVEAWPAPGSHRQRQLDGQQPHRPGPQYPSSSPLAAKEMVR